MDTEVSPRKISINRSVLESLEREFIALDLETTGLDSFKDRIIEIGAVRFVNGRAKKAFSALVHPSIPIPPQASRINGVTNEMVYNAPSESEAISQFIAFIGDALHGKTVMCAHNASFDFNFLRKALDRSKIRSKIVYTDTLTASKAVIKGLDNYRQDTILKYFNLRNPQAHRAKADALYCGKIMCKLFPLLEAQIRKAEETAKKKIITEEEMQICIHLKSLLMDQSAERLDYLRCDKTASGYVQITCLYPFITFRIMKKGKYIIIPQEIAKRKKIMGEPCAKNEPLDGIRYFFESPTMLNIFAQYFNRAFKEQYRGIQSYLRESDYYCEKTLNAIGNQTRIPDNPNFFM